NKEGRIIAHGIANVALALAKGENAGAQSLGAMTAEAVGMLSEKLYNKPASQLTEDEKATVSAFASLAAGIAGGLVGGDTSSAGNAAQAGKTTVENNYLSDSEHRQKTSLELKEQQGKITEVEQQKLAELRIKDTETTQKLLDTCAGGVSPECTAARKDAFETIDTYVSLTYQNPKTAQAGYQEIERLLNSTSPEAQQAYNLLESYTEAFKNFGYTDEEARTRAGMYVGSIYLLGGMSAVANSGALVKQFGKDVAKPNVTTPKGNNAGAGSNWTADKNGAFSPKDDGTVTNVGKGNSEFDGKTIYDAKGNTSKNTTVKDETTKTLIYHENFGGHAISRHVGKTDAQLLARFESEPNVLASSTFTNMKTADWAIGNGIGANQDKISAFMAGNGTRIILTHETSADIGRVIRKGQTQSTGSNKIVIVIDKDPLMPNGYKIQTAYPK
ncbi:RNase A-like domain-containing protein, partial [Providencia huaxiensis]